MITKRGREFLWSLAAISSNPAELAAWRARIDEWEEGVVADARLAGAVPVIDYRDRPFAVPPEVEAELRRRADPRWREGRARDSADARRGAARRRRLAEMLRERGDGAGAAAQDAAAGGLDAEAARAAADAGGDSGAPCQPPPKMPRSV